MKNVSYIAFESAMTRSERHARRLTWALIAAMAVFAASNFAWMLVLIR